MKQFGFGFALGLGIFALATTISYFVLSDGHGVQAGNDGIQRAGFPLVFWERGGFSYRHEFSVMALAANLAMAVLPGILISVVYWKMSPDPSV